MKPRIFTAIALTAIAMLSCDEDTDGIGASLTTNTDKLEISTGIYNAFSRSVLADSVYARNDDCYFGRIKDPETGAYVKSEFMTQVNMLEGYSMPDKSKIINIDANGNVVADSCEFWLYFNQDESYGDSLAPLKMNIQELIEPMSDGQTYYSNFDPRAEGLIRADGLNKSMVFTMANLTYTDSVRNLSDYINIARVTLDDTYYDKEGNEYDNYGSYILRNFYDHPEYFRNSYSFVHKMCPGFYFGLSDGLGLMAKLAFIEMRVFYTFQGDTTAYNAAMVLSSTPEVLLTARVTNDRAALNKLVADQSCTYLKSPAGIFTEITLPVDEIMQAHRSDSLLSVNITIQRQNSDLSNDPYILDTPANILMLQKDSLSKFFESESLYDYKTAFMGTLISNSYAFTNIGNMIVQMSNNKEAGLSSDPEWVTKHPNWNKVLLLPVATTTTYTASGTSSITSINNQMGLTSTKLMGGPDHPIEVEVIYAKFKTK